MGRFEEDTLDFSGSIAEAEIFKTDIESVKTLEDKLMDVEKNHDWIVKGL